MKIIKHIIIWFAFGLGSFNGISKEYFVAPTYSNLGNQSVLQNSGTPTVTSISGWAFNITAITPLFIISNINTNGSLAFEATGNPTVDPVTGDLTFTLTPNTSGFATFNVQLQDQSTGELSIISTIQLDVLFVNGAPTFTVNTPDITVNEKSGPVSLTSWATSITPGLNQVESSQSVNFITEIVSQTTFMSFNAFPKVDKFGTFTFEATNKANGSALIKIYLVDDGSDIAPNVNRSLELEITLTINPINDAPTFTKGENIIIDEHNGPVNINWAKQVSAGAPDEDISQQISFVLSQKEINGNLQFDIPPTIDNTGVLNFTATPHTNGYIIYELTLQDDGINSPLPNTNTSNVQAFTITVNYINDPPTFNQGADLVIDEGDVVYTFDNWATNISPGQSPNEQSQQLHFTVNYKQVSGNLAFLMSPQIDANGTLTFRSTEHTHGEAIFDIYLTDDGEFTLPHENTSTLTTFKITVTPVNFPPNNIQLNNQAIQEAKPPGTEVGILSTSDLDPEDTHNYALVAGEGSEGNEFFTLEGDILITNTTFNWDNEKSYSIRIKSSDGEFSIEKIFEITILKLIEGVKFASAITPNSDGQNDTWEMEDIDAFPNALIFIYDKAGLTVFNSSGGYTPWDGTYNGIPLPMGTYYYIIDLRDGSPIYKGTITILL